MNMIFLTCSVQLQDICDFLLEVYPFLHEGQFYKDNISYQLGTDDEEIEKRVGFLFETSRSDKEMEEAVIELLLRNHELTETQLPALRAHFEDCRVPEEITHTVVYNEACSEELNAEMEDVVIDLGLDANAIQDIFDIRKHYQKAIAEVEEQIFSDLWSIVVTTEAPLEDCIAESCNGTIHFSFWNEERDDEYLRMEYFTYTPSEHDCYYVNQSLRVPLIPSQTERASKIREWLSAFNEGGEVFESMNKQNEHWFTTVRPTQLLNRTIHCQIHILE